MMRVSVIERALDRFFHFYPGVVAIVGAKDPSHGANFMPAVWNTGLSFDPPLFGVSISPKRHTYRLLENEAPWSVSFLSFEHAELAARLGSTSGRDLNKVKAFDLEVLWGKALEVPILKNAFAAYELEPAGRVKTGDHDLFIGRVRAVWEDGAAFNEEGIPLPERVRPLLYFGRFRYGSPDEETVRLKFR